MKKQIINEDCFKEIYVFLSKYEGLHSCTLEIHQQEVNTNEHIMSNKLIMYFPSEFAQKA